MTARSRDRRLGIVAIVLAVIAACAAAPQYSNRGAPDRSQPSDTEQCSAKARAAVPLTLDPVRDAWSVSYILRHTFDSCMQARGWRHT